MADDRPDYWNDHPDPHGSWVMSEYDVILEDAGQGRVRVMQAIRAQSLGMGWGREPPQLKVAKDLIDRAPTRVARRHDRGEAYGLARSLHAAGATVRVVHRYYETLAACYAGDAPPIRSSDTVTREVPEGEWLT